MRPAERLGLRDQFGARKFTPVLSLALNPSSDVYLSRSLLKHAVFLSLLSLFCFLIFNFRTLAV